MVPVFIIEPYHDQWVITKYRKPGITPGSRGQGEIVSYHDSEEEADAELDRKIAFLRAEDGDTDAMRELIGEIPDDELAECWSSFVNGNKADFGVWLANALTRLEESA